MSDQTSRRFSSVVEGFVKSATALEFLMAFLVVIPLTLWFAWARHSEIAEAVILTFFCISFAWLNISILRWRRGLRKLGWTSPGRVSFGLGPRPEDPDELAAWQRGAHSRNSILAVLLCMVAFGIIKWLQGDY